MNIMINRISIIIVLFCVISLSFAGCATLPTNNKVKQFGLAAEKSATIMKEALAANAYAVTEMSRIREADQYIIGAPFFLTLTAEDRALMLNASEQLAALDALNAYASALAKAADQGVVSELRSASANLASAAGDVASVAAPTSVPIVGPAFQFGGRLFGLALGNAYAAEIQLVITSSDAAVQELSKRMPDSLDAVATFVDSVVLQYEVERQTLLDTIRAGDTVDRAQLFAEYSAARSDVQLLMHRASILRNSAVIFQQLARAHQSLAEGSADADQFVQEFTLIVSDLTALLSALQSN